ncbi:ABC transporter permease [Oceanomicrobium pacificus]|uniref:Autoinducer 2 import system permease protein LsrC n=1 Tax=Oceanomicrobium pacificus TaxID=2692916 RepID=A0A6B0TKV3_9RHOB|nr:ABC transporter permease [Oceanomicrobium pacificus]MXU65150.1 ABC transporter permease [Oceanomicrobium pacificus]
MTRLFLRVSPQALRITGLLFVLCLVVLFFSTQVDNYLNGRLFNRISSSVAIMALIATGQTIVILTRNIDLSVGSVVGFTAFATGSLVTAYPDMGPVPLVLFAMVCGAGFGCINGALVAYARVPSIIVTLATMALFRSALVEFSDAKSITSGSLPQWLVSFPNTKLLTIGQFQLRAGFAVAVVVVVLVHILLSRFRPARRFYAVGSSPEAAEMAGINTRATVFAAFVLAGALAGLAGFMFLARFGNITVVAGLGFELKSVAASVVGGVNIFGGSGTVIGAFLGAILVDLIDTSLVRWQLVSEFWREAVLGALILLSVTVDTLLMRRLFRLRQAQEHEAAKPKPAAAGKVTKEGAA